MKPPIDGTLDSNKWKSSLLPQHKHRDVGVIKPPPRVPNVKVLLKRIERQRASESESSAGTASTGTTVQTKRLNNRLQPSNMVQPQSMAELLTMSLGSRKVSEILHKLSLDDYAAFFEEQDVDFEAFLELTPDDIRELGINDQRSRIKIMRAIQSLRRKGLEICIDVKAVLVYINHLVCSTTGLDAALPPSNNSSVRTECRQ
ncbi:hypothetical protein HAZT_HAZT008457 [Hyalella azteca]|uniref:SAM domain-containing protein n=1 Tax=Hyalella azteca TaxID=294128 RepID=A0A6A0HCW6_HYAAZ|nr:hypothetical protein HAZT_HAZT008457 [Hyalella azteca]